MVPWWTILIPAIIAICFWIAWASAAERRDEVLRAVRLVEMEYRLMTQNNELFKRVDETHQELMRALTAQRESIGVMGEVWHS